MPDASTCLAQKKSPSLAAAALLAWTFTAHAYVLPARQLALQNLSAGNSHIWPVFGKAWMGPPAWPTLRPDRCESGSLTDDI